MELYPAIDLIGGQAVRLVQGDFGRSTTYGDPLDVARSYVEHGVSWLHVVDLDAARDGVGANRSVVAAICALGVAVQVGGGARSYEDVASLLDCGAIRVVVGTIAVEDPALVTKLADAFPGRLAVGLDYRAGHDGRLEVAVRGWQAGSGLNLGEVTARLAGAELSACIVTAIERDGTFSGPDVEGLAATLSLSPWPVIASGGVGSIDDLVALSAVVVQGRTLAGAIVGKALLDGRMELDEALAACEPSA